MTEQADSTPCPACLAKRRAHHAWGYCPHNEILSIAVIGESGTPCGWRHFGPLSEAEANEAVKAGLAAGSERFQAETGQGAGNVH